ncbi:MAG TPA: ferric uptake regulation protein [candidate division Zixibacteria bacterium]|nr:ferric uptake regulation protein [candidate division Zixibacteria bacterium]
MPRRCWRGGHGWRGLGCGQRLTAPRQAIYQALSGAQGHLSADEIFLRVRGRMPGIGLATVYRNLELLRTGGHIRSVDAGDGKARYELHQAAGGPGHHHHLICRQCGQVIDYMDFEKDELALVKKLETQLSGKYKYQIAEHDITFYGTCPNCAKRD